MQKRLSEHADYFEVLNSGLILSRKDKYNMRDFKSLIESGWSHVDARWIILCSAAHHKVKVLHIFDTEKFLMKCIKDDEDSIT